MFRQQIPPVLKEMRALCAGVVKKTLGCIHDKLKGAKARNQKVWVLEAVQSGIHYVSLSCSPRFPVFPSCLITGLDFFKSLSAFCPSQIFFRMSQDIGWTPTKQQNYTCHTYNERGSLPWFVRNLLQVIPSTTQDIQSRENKHFVLQWFKYFSGSGECYIVSQEKVIKGLGQGLSGDK